MTTAARKSTLLVQDVMQRDPVTVSLGMPIREVAEVLDGNQVSGAPVLDLQQRCVGVISRTDILQWCIEGPLGDGTGSLLDALQRDSDDPWSLDPDKLGMVEDMMSDDPVTARPDEPVSAVARRMAEEGVHRVVVLDEQKRVLGLVSTLQLLAVFPE
mgnify:CR=1 FL=1